MNEQDRPFEPVDQEEYEARKKMAKDTIWANVEPSLKAYSNLIEKLLTRISLKKLEALAEEMEDS